MGGSYFLSVLIILAILLSAPLAESHGGGLSKRDGCHRDRQSGALHDHRPGTVEPHHACERKGKITIKTAPPSKSRVVVKERVVKKFIKSVNVRRFEESLKRSLERLEKSIAAEARRAPRVVKVKVEVPGRKPTTEQCVELRAKFLASAGKWGNASERVALTAIEAGCW